MPIISPDIWITKEGKELEITKMASSHLLLTIHMIERRRFESAIECHEQGLVDGTDWSDAINYYLTWPIQYENMVREAQRRNLIHRGIESPATSTVVTQKKRLRK